MAGLDPAMEPDNISQGGTIRDQDPIAVLDRTHTCSERQQTSSEVLSTRKGQHRPSRTEYAGRTMGLQILNQRRRPLENKTGSRRNMARSAATRGGGFPAHNPAQGGRSMEDSGRLAELDCSTSRSPYCVGIRTIQALLFRDAAGRASLRAPSRQTPPRQ